MLCFIRYHEDGLIEVSPGLSEFLQESPEEVQLIGLEDVVPLSSLMSDSTVIHGAKKGFKLSTFHLRSNDGSDFEFAVENVNEVLVPSVLEHVRELQSEVDSQALVSNLGLDEKIDAQESWKQDPPATGSHFSIAYNAGKTPSIRYSLIHHVIIP